MTMIQETNIILNGTTTKIDPNKEYTMTKDGLVETKDPLKEKYFTVKEAAKECGMPVSTINNAIYRGRLLAIQIPDSSNWGYHHMIKETDLIDYIDNPKAIRDADKANRYNDYQRENLKKHYKPKHPTTVPVDANGNPMLTINDIRDRTGRGVCAIRDAMAKGSLIADKYLCGRAHKWFASEEAVNTWVENLKRNERIVDKKEEPVVVQEEEVSVKSSGRFVPNDLANLQLAIAELMVKAREEAYDEAYKKGFEDGKLSVENDSKDEYRKGYEQGKKEAKEELLAALKVM